jgi:hypothetical protein
MLKKALIIQPAVPLRKVPAQAKADPKEPVGAIRPRLGPSARAEFAGEAIRLFNLFFIYGEADGYVLIGRRSEFNLSQGLDEPRRAILGWVPESRICRWLTREAISWRPGALKKAGIVYDTAQDAENALNGRAVKAVVVEQPRPDGLFGRPLLFSQMRFPLLDWDVAEPVARKQGGNELMRIGVVVGFRGDEDVPLKDRDAARLSFSSRISKETEKVFASKGIPIEELRKIQGMQVVQVGYVWRNNADGEPQTSGSMLINDGELERFLTKTAGLDLPPGQPGWISVKEFLESMVKSLAGEIDLEKNPSEV